MDPRPPSSPPSSPSPNPAPTTTLSETEIPHLDASPDCPFCTIITTYAPISPLSAPSNSLLDPQKLDPPAYVILSTAHVIAFLDVYPLVRGHVLICPRRHGVKVGDLSVAEGREIGALLPLLSRALTHATTPDIPHTATDYNIVQNNGPGAAQVIPHTHFHFVPRYPFDYEVVAPHPIMLDEERSDERLSRDGSKGRKSGEGEGQSRGRRETSAKLVFSSGRQYSPIKRPEGMEATRILFGRGQRHYRDEEESEELVEVMRRCVRVEWEREFGGGSGSEGRRQGEGEGEGGEEQRGEGQRTGRRKGGGEKL